MSLCQNLTERKVELFLSRLIVKLITIQWVRKWIVKYRFVRDRSVFESKVWTINFDI